MDRGHHVVLEEAVQLRDRVAIAGRGGTFRYNNADHSIEMGLLVAKNLLGEDHDVEAVNIGGGYHEAKVVGP